MNFIKKPIYENNGWAIKVTLINQRVTYVVYQVSNPVETMDNTHRFENLNSAIARLVSTLSNNGISIKKDDVKFSIKQYYASASSNNNLDYEQAVPILRKVFSKHTALRISNNQGRSDDYTCEFNTQTCVLSCDSYNDNNENMYTFVQKLEKLTNNNLQLTNEEIYNSLSVNDKVVVVKDIIDKDGVLLAKAGDEYTIRKKESGNNVVILGEDILTGSHHVRKIE